jgi:hypothetical protein
MQSRLLAGLTLTALTAMSAGVSPAAATAPAPAPTPLKTITHVRSSPLCTGLRRAIGPAVGKVLQNDGYIARSRPMFKDFVSNSTLGSKAGVDMDVMHMEGLISPLVQNTQAIQRYLNDPILKRRALSDQDKQLIEMRQHLLAVLDQQKQALDLISGFVDTQQLGELQAAGHEYDKAIQGSDQGGNGHSPTAVSTPVGAPTTAPNDLLNAGLPSSPSDPRNNDPRYLGTGNSVGYNPLKVFDEQVGVYQQAINASENLAAQAVIKAAVECGGKVPPPAQVVTPSPTP